MSETTKIAYVEKRSQHSVGGGNSGFGGPDTYWAVQVVPAGAKRLVCLNAAAAKRRGIEIIHCGDGYSDRQQTASSMYNVAKTEAYRVAGEINLTNC